MCIRLRGCVPSIISRQLEGSRLLGVLMARAVIKGLTYQYQKTSSIFAVRAGNSMRRCIGKRFYN